jgi:hypothetical protein
VGTELAQEAGREVDSDRKVGRHVDEVADATARVLRRADGELGDGEPTGILRMCAPW